MTRFLLLVFIVCAPAWGLSCAKALELLRSVQGQSTFGSLSFAKFLRDHMREIDITSDKVDGKDYDREFQGFLNRGIYFYTAEDGTRRTVKVLRLDAEKERLMEMIAREENLYLMELTKRRDPDKDATSFLDQLIGAHLAEEQGGAVVHSFGIANVQMGLGEAKKYYFIEMEALKENAFDQNAYSLKDALRGPAKGAKRVLGEKNSEGRNAMEELAHKTVVAMESKIIPEDPDLMIYQNGAVARWLDSGSWREVATLDASVKENAHHTSVVYGLLGKDVDRRNLRYIPKWRKSYLLALLAEIKKSKVLSPSQKLLFCKNFGGRFELITLGLLDAKATNKDAENYLIRLVQ
jgi:hypothetical protein